MMDSIGIKFQDSLHRLKPVQTVLFFLLVPFFVRAQFSPYNLVPNPSFEQYTVCPTSFDFNDAKDARPDFWYKPDLRGARYFNACANGFSNNNNGMPINFAGGGYNYQFARNGNGYVAMFYYNVSDARNYIAVKLKDSLQQDKCYYAEYYVNLINSYYLGCNNQSMLFTNTPVYVDTNAVPAVYMLPANPQITNYGNPVITDTLNWVKVSGVFTAQGGEQYLTLGNFRNNAQTVTQQIQPTGYNGAVYYLDDVSVIPLDSLPLKADAGPDRIITAGNSVYIGSYTNGLTNTTWFNSSGAVINTGVPGIIVSPAASTFYIIQQTVCGYTSRDTVNVNVGAVPLQITDYRLQIADAKKVKNVWATANEVNVSHFNIQRSRDGINFHTIQQAQAKNNSYNEYSFVDMQPLAGTSYYRLECVDRDGKITYSKTLSITLGLSPYTLNLYPNPAKDFVMISYPKIKQVSILDIAGRVVLAKDYQNVDELKLNIGGLQKGIFLVRVSGNENKIATQKLIIE